MIENTFIPVFIPHLHKYLLDNFNIDINKIPIEDWHGLISNNYCKNITNNTYCLKKYKKNINDDNIDFCSKCSEKKGIKRKKVYKSKKDRKKEINSDSGFYSESDNEKIIYDNNIIADKTIKNVKFKNIKKRIMIKIKILNYFKNLLKVKKINVIKEEEDYIFCTNTGFYNRKKKNNNLNVNLVGSKDYHKYIMFGDLEFKFEDRYFKINNNYKNLNVKHEKFMNNNFIQFGSLTFNLNPKENKKENYLLNNNIYKEGKEKLINYNNYMNEDTYYIFLYIIDLIFKTKNIDYIREELYNCLGPFNIDFYKSQLNIF